MYAKKDWVVRMFPRGEIWWDWHFPQLVTLKRASFSPFYIFNFFRNLLNFRGPHRTRNFHPNSAKFVYPTGLDGKTRTRSSQLVFFSPNNLQHSSLKPVHGFMDDLYESGLNRREYRISCLKNRGWPKVSRNFFSREAIWGYLYIYFFSDAYFWPNHIYSGIPKIIVFTWFQQTL